MTEDALRKRKEREEKRAAAARAKAIAEGLDVGVTDALVPGAPNSVSVPPPSAEDDRPSSLSASSQAQIPAYTITLPASSTSLSWYHPEESTYETIEEARAAGVWTYPADLHERAKCGVFRDLWEKGNFMGGGIKFGGDFLVYPGTSRVSAIMYAGVVGAHVAFKRQVTLCDTTHTSWRRSLTPRSRR